MMHHADSYGIYPEYVEESIPSQSIFIDGYFNIASFANASGISMDDIQRLNPHILREYLPPWTHGFELKIPESKVAYYNANQKAILDSAGRQPNQASRAMMAQQNIPQSSIVQPESGIIVIGANNSVPVTAQEAVAVEDKDPNDKPDEDV